VRNLLPGIRFLACAVLLSAVVLVVSIGNGAAAVGRNLTARPTKVVSTDVPKQVDVYATYYGWYDNTPPGCATAYSGCAGGKGTYAHPITFASDKKEFPVGTILYYPTVEKYFVMGDECQECAEDWNGKGPDGGPHLYHVDLWIGGKGANAFDVINCEDALTQGMPNGDPLLTPFIRNPPSSEPVSTQPLFNAKTNQCYGGATTSTTYGRYENKKTGDCLEDPSDSTKSGTPAEAAPCTSGKPEDLAFDGAFFIVKKLCLQTEGSKVGSYLDFATCNGNAREQWEINPNGTITWIQYARCIEQSGDKIKMAKCTTSAAEQWTFTSEPSS
jgi:hypothetical protein